MSKDEDDLVRRLQSRADAARSQPIALRLDSPPGPYKLPLCNRVGVNGSEGSAELLLQTKSGHLIVAPVTNEALADLLDIVERFVRPNKPSN